jgi:hypothetical protein
MAGFLHDPLAFFNLINRSTSLVGLAPFKWHLEVSVCPAGGALNNHENRLPVAVVLLEFVIALAIWRHLDQTGAVKIRMHGVV